MAEQYGCPWTGGVSPTEMYRDGHKSKKDDQQMFRNQTEIFVRHKADFLIAEVR